jgi:hypothetical protein
VSKKDVDAHNILPVVALPPRTMRSRSITLQFISLR